MQQPGVSPGDLTYPAHIQKGLNRYLQSALNVQPDFSGINSMFSSFGNMQPMVRGGQFIDPSQAQQIATPGYLSARGNIASTGINNMFNLASMLSQGGVDYNTAMNYIPQLMAAQTRLQTAGGPAGLFGSVF